MTVKSALDTAKEIFDLAADIPGIAAFVKVFFGEAGQKKMEDRLLKDKRDELFEDISFLPEMNRKKILRRLKQAARRGEEDQLVWNLCKVSREVRPNLLKWLDSLDDREFKVMIDLLDDNKLHQFIVRMTRLAKGQVVLPVKAAAEVTFSAVRTGAERADHWAANTAAPRVHELRRRLEKLDRKEGRLEKKGVRR